MIAADREHAPSAQEIEVALAVLVEQVLTPPGTEANIEADGLEHADHLRIEMARMQGVALGFPLGEQRRGVQGHAILLAAAGHHRRPTRIKARTGQRRKLPLWKREIHEFRR